MQVEWDDDGLKRLTDEIVREQTRELQAIFDRVLELGKGKTVEEVKGLLAQKLRPDSDTEITNKELMEWAQLLAEGTRIEVKPGAE